MTRQQQQQQVKSSTSTAMATLRTRLATKRALTRWHQAPRHNPRLSSQLSQAVPTSWIHSPRAILISSPTRPTRSTTRRRTTQLLPVAPLLLRPEAVLHVNRRAMGRPAPRRLLLLRLSCAPPSTAGQLPSYRDHHHFKLVNIKTKATAAAVAMKKRPRDRPTATPPPRRGAPCSARASPPAELS